MDPQLLRTCVGSEIRSRLFGMMMVTQKTLLSVGCDVIFGNKNM